MGILWLFVRRFFVRPKWLGELSWGSGLVALLIFALMATYLAAFFVTGEGGAAQALWWERVIAPTRSALSFIPKVSYWS